MPDTTRPQPSDKTSEALDPIPLEDTFVFTEPNEAGTVSYTHLRFVLIKRNMTRPRRSLLT